jgi:hypothetical protein
MTPRAALPSDRFSVDQLVLPVSETVDPEVLNLAKYDDFIEALVRGRGFQRAALVTALRFLFGGRYASVSRVSPRGLCCVGQPQAQVWVNRRSPGATSIS